MSNPPNVQPPEYAPGSSVVRKCNFNDHEVASVGTDGPLGMLRRPGDVISGRVLVHPTMPFRFSRIDIELQMVESSIKPKAYGEARTTRNITLSKYRVSQDDLPRDKVLKSGYEYSFYYSFVLPEALPISACGKGLHEHYQLPPTIGDENNAYFDVCPAKITYRLLARIWGVEKPVATAFTTVKVSPRYINTTESSENNCVSTFANELRKGLLRKSSIGSCKLSVSSPPDVHLDCKTPFLFDLDLSYTPSSNERTLRAVQRVSYKLRAHTITSSEPLSYVPGISDTTLNHHATNITHQQRENPNVPWFLEDSTGVGSSDIQRYKASLQLPVVLPNFDSNLVPQFSTCLTTRLYSLLITVYFGSSISTSIVVPVSVVASPQLSAVPTPSHMHVEHSYYARRSIFGPTPPYEALYPFATTNSQGLQQSDGRYTPLQGRSSGT